MARKKNRTELEYPAVIRPLSAEEGSGYLIEYPDLPGCRSDGETIAEAIANGADAIACWIAAMKADGRDRAGCNAGEGAASPEDDDRSRDQEGTGEGRRQERGKGAPAAPGEGVDTMNPPPRATVMTGPAIEARRRRRM